MTKPSSPTPPPTPLWQVVAPILLATVVFTWNAWGPWDTVVDDAYISARYAEHFADGFGLVYSQGEPPVEGYTNLAWTVLLGLGRMVGLPILGLMTGMGWAFGVLALVFAVLLTRRLSDGDGLLLGVPALVLACSPHFAVASTNGLESSMMVAMVLGALWSHLALTGERRWMAGAMSAGLVATRPEGLVVVAAIVAHDLFTHRHDLKKALPLSGVAVAFTVALFSWRLLTYGVPLPNTFYAKSSFPLSKTFSVNEVYLTPNQVPLWAALAAWTAGTLLPPYHLRRWLVSAVGLALGIIPLTVNLWMPGLRLFLPAMAISAILLTVGLSRLPRMAGWVTGAALVLASFGYDLSAGEAVRSYDWRHSVQPVNGAERVAKLLAEQAPEGAWLATRDAGVFAYFVGTGVRVAELHQRALTQPHPDGKNARFLEYTPINPEFLVVTQRREKTEGYVYGNDKDVFERVTMPYVYLGRVHQHYHRYYDVYARGDLGIAPLPAPLVVSMMGPKPLIEAVPGEAAAVFEPLPDTGL